MTEVAYYMLESGKFLMIYLLGFSMILTKDLKRRLLAAGGIVFTGILMNYFKLSVIYPILYTVYAVFLFYILMEQVSYRDIVIVFWSGGVILSVDTISYVLVRLCLRITEYHLSQYQNLFAGCITLMILGIIFGIISHYQKTGLQELSMGYFIVFLIICIVNASVLVLIEKKLMNVHGEFTAIYVMLAASSLVQMAFVLVLASSNNWHRKNEKLKEQYLELQVEHYQYLEERNLATKRFRHDMRAHMLAVKKYICEEKWNELEDYIDTICGNIEQIPGYLSVKNETVDAILNYYAAQFTKRNCMFHVNGRLPQGCYVRDYDLCTIFSNLMSNALESVERLTQKGSVELSVHFDDTLIFIREKNTYNGDLNRQGNRLLTTKQNKELHGFGIRNIQDSVEKYSGMIDIEIQEQNFVIDIVMENIAPLGENKEKGEKHNAYCHC